MVIIMTGGVSMLIWLAGWSLCSLTGADAATIWSLPGPPQSSVLTTDFSQTNNLHLFSLQEFGDSARARRLYADDDDDEEEQELEPNPKLAQGRQKGIMMEREISTIMLSVVSCLMNIN